MTRNFKVIIFLVLSLSCYIFPFQLAQGEECSKTMGPYITHDTAARDAQRYENKGYSTSGIWGEGGIIGNWSNRKYFFNLFYQC
jgi:hypothetical protein